MQYYNLKIAIFLKNNLQNYEAYEKIGNLISFAMLKNENLKELHEKNIYKNYVYCNLYPIEKDSYYKRNQVYQFDIRGIEIEKMMKLKQVLNSVENEDFKVINVRFETSEQRKINKLITLTPVIITMPKGDYDIQDDMDFIKKRILDNIQKKYKELYKSNIEVDFIEEIRKINLKPIKIPYKNIHMLGNKFEIKVKEDPISQNLAYLMLAIGCGEKNSLGFGFCKAK